MNPTYSLRVLLSVCLLAFCSALAAQKKDTKPKQKQNQVKAEQPVKVVPSVADDARALIKEYRFEEAEKMILAEQAKEKRSKIEESVAKNLLSTCEKGKTMLGAVQKVTFIDSVVVDRKTFFKAYQLSAALGSIGPLQSLIDKQAIKGANQNDLAFLNEFRDKVVFTMRNSKGFDKLYQSDCVAGQWQTPQPLRGTSAADNSVEGYPFLMSDGTTLYFSSISDEGLGGFDIYATRYDPEKGTYLRPENIGMPFNSPANDYMYAVDEEGSRGWFATDRFTGSPNRVCIYTFIPTSSGETYSSPPVSADSLRRLAMLHSIGSQVRKARTNSGKSGAQEENAGKDLFIVINDATVYHSLDEFKDPRARRIAAQMLDKQKELSETETEIEQVGRQPRTQANRRRLTQLGQRRTELRKQVDEMGKNIRNAENK